MAVTTSLDIGPIIERLGAMNSPAALGRAMQAIAADLAGDVALGFKSQTDPWGNPWKALADSTLEMRRKHGKGAEILRDTGVGQASIHAVHDMLSATLSVGPNASGYMSKHQDGRGVPRRAFFPIDEAGNIKLTAAAMASVIDHLETAAIGGAA